MTHNFNIWTANAIKEISGNYIAEYRLATDPTRPSPLRAYADIVEQRKKVSNQMRQIFGGRK